MMNHENYIYLIQLHEMVPADEPIYSHTADYDALLVCRSSNGKNKTIYQSRER